MGTEQLGKPVLQDWPPRGQSGATENEKKQKNNKQLEELVLKRNLDVTMQHTNGHALDTYRASNPRENDRNAKSMSPGTTRATQGDHRWHKVPCHAKTHLASQPRARVTSEETRPRHI